MLRYLRIVSCLAFGLAAQSAVSAAGGQPLTAEEIFRPSFLGQAELSPDGSHLAAIVGDDQDTLNLLVVDLKTGQTDGLRGDRSLDLHTFHWMDDQHVLFNVSQDKHYAFGLYVARLGELRRFDTINSNDVTELVGLPRARPTRALVWIVQSADNEGRPGDLVELDSVRAKGNSIRGLTRGDALARTYSPPKSGIVLGWETNYDGELALCYTYADAHTRLHRYLRDRGIWEAVPLDLDAVKPMQLDPDERFLWVVTHDEKRGFELRRYNLDTHQLAEPVQTDAQYDMSGGTLFFSAGTRQLAGVSYLQRRHTTVWFAKDCATVQAAVNQRYPDTDNVLIDRDRRDRKFLFRSTGAQQPGVYVLVDLEARTMKPFAEAAPWLKGRPLQPLQTIAFRTRDGVTLEGYLMLPPGASESHPVPLVVLPHGGPWVRDEWAFDPEAQFLASRGYAVLQPNYRGSTGYAPVISLDHRFDFRRMHDDVTDATKTVLLSGLVDPKRVAIMGGSFGGYLALSGVAFEPDLYRCAVSLCGVFDWESLIKTSRDEGRPGDYEYLRDNIGRPGQDREHFDAISPLAHVDRIHVPVFVAHGMGDHIVDVAQSQKLAAALEKQGVPHETFFRAFEGHGFQNYKNNVEFYHRVEAFLAANLGGLSLSPVP